MKKVRGVRHLERAWNTIEDNARNSKSEDVRKEIDAFREGASRNLRSLSAKLVRGTFRFPPAKGVPIAKLDKGKKNKKKFRPIVIATVESRIVQRAILDVLLTIPALKAYAETPYSFGGIRKTSESELAAVPAAIRAVLASIGDGARFVATADISQFFTRISKSAVTAIVSDAVRDDELVALFRKAIHVELSNMAQLREKSDAFPIGDIGVAQGNSLSPLLGNIILHSFDRVMNEGDCRCIRYIDDFIILAPTRRAALARMQTARGILQGYGMTLSEEKSSKDAVDVTSGFEFLGIELNNGFIRPSRKAQQKVLKSITDSFRDSQNAFFEFRNGNALPKPSSLLSTLKRADGIVQGWGKHYRFCNDGAVWDVIDARISELVRAYLGVYSQTVGRVASERRRSLLGIGLLSEIERRPFEWPKTERREPRAA